MAPSTAASAQPRPGTVAWATTATTAAVRKTRATASRASGRITVRSSRGEVRQPAEKTSGGRKTRKIASGSSSTVGRPGTKAIARPPTTSTIGAGTLPNSARRTSSVAASIRTRIDSMWFMCGITSCRVDDTLSPPLDAEDHIRGELGRPLELVMFGDFQCPFCLGAQSVLRRVHERLGDRLVFAFRHLPIPERHPLAPLAAEASEAAAAQGRFWEYHDALFAAQPKLSRETMLAVGRDLGLDAERMAAEIDSGVHRPRIERDIASAEASGATGTPSFFVNGKRHFGAYDASSLVEELEAGAATGR